MKDEGNNGPAVSVILPTQARNLEYLNQAVLSVLRQTLQNIEVLVVFDGCSHEKAAEALSGFSDPRLRPIVSERHRGLPRCLNIGVWLARAPLVARMDDDDRCLPARLERQVDAMRASSVDVLGTWSWVIDEQGQRTSGEPFCPDPTLPFSPTKAVFGHIFVHPSVMMRRDWILRHRYDPTWGYGEDRELWVRGAGVSRYACIPEPLLEYRVAATVKPSRMKGVINTYRLIWHYRRRFGIWVPLLLLLNLARQSVYWFRIRFGR